MGKLCAAAFCRKEIGEVTGYPFPYHDKKRLQIWQKRLLVANGPTSQTSYACYRHFSDKQFHFHSGGLRKKMKQHAIPDKNIVRRTRSPNHPLDAVCRFCLERSLMDYQMICPVWPNPDIPSAEDIAELFGIVITPDDILPRIVCVTCTTKIKYFKRIRDQFQKNDAILRAQFVPQMDEDDPPSAPRPTPLQPKKPVVPIVEPNYSSGDTAPKITAVASLGQNPVEIPTVSSGSDDVLQEAFGSVVYIQEGNTYQQFQIISSNQIMPMHHEHEEVVRTSVKVEPTDMGSNQVDDTDTEILYMEDADVEAENEQMKIEYQQPDFGSLSAEDEEEHDELEEHPPEKKLRVDRPFRYADQIKLEKDET